MTKPTIQELYEFYKKILELSDWTIEFSVVRQLMLSTDTCGNNEYTHQCKAANIKVLDEIDGYGRVTEYDQEVALVHELLHCVFASIDMDKDIIFERMQHQIIQTVAQAIVASRRTADKE